MVKPAVEFEVEGAELHLVYRGRGDGSWVHDHFLTHDEVVIKGTFHLQQCDLKKGQKKPEADDFSDEDMAVHFLVAIAKGKYFVFKPNIFRIDVPVLVARNASPTWKWFSAEEKVSVIRLLAELKPTRIVIGGDAADAIPIEEYERLIAKFPTSYELRRYVLSRLSVVFRELTDAKVDAGVALRKYVAKRVGARHQDLIQPFRESEIAKYQFLQANLQAMLLSAEGYSEDQWQGQILDVVRLLNPKYIAAFSKVTIKDSVTGGRRQIDILLVDASGNVDVIEIKKPFMARIVTETTYRDNHVPHRELAGTVTQVEKYLFHLSRWGKTGEEKLTEKYRQALPGNLRVRIVNPCGLVIMGRDNDLTDDQKADFEVFRRQNKNVVDIITYDDLLRRLDIMLRQLKANR